VCSWRSRLDSLQTNWRMVEVVLYVSSKQDARLRDHTFLTASNDVNRPQIDERDHLHQMRSRASFRLAFAAGSNKTASLAGHPLTGWIYLGTAD
jgi:hypothetical protein